MARAIKLSRGGESKFTEFDYTPKQRCELMRSIDHLPRILDGGDRDAFSPFLHVADATRRGLRQCARTGTERRELAEATRAWRDSRRAAEFLRSLFESGGDDASQVLQTRWRKLELPVDFEAVTRALFYVELFATIMEPRQGALCGPGEATIVREFYYWLCGAWAALGGRYTYTRKDEPNNKVDGPLVCFLLAAADPVLGPRALKRASLKHVIEAARRLRPIAPIRTRSRTGGAARLWGGYKGGPVVVTHVHMRGQN